MKLCNFDSLFMCSVFQGDKTETRCLKITEKVSFNIASYVCNLSGQLLIKNVKNGQFGEFLKI